MDDDKAQIAEVLIRYATGIDFKDWPLFRSCWTDDIDVDYGDLGHFETADAITDLMTRIHDGMGCLAGSATLAVYSAVKAFQHNFAEGLWAELRPHGVDVCCTPLGMTYTPAVQRMGVDYDPQAQMLSEDVAREIIENIGSGPVHVVGNNNRVVVGAGAIGLSAVAALVARGVQPIIVSDYSDERLEFAKKFGADVLVKPSQRSAYDVWREVAQANKIQKPQVIFECVGAPGLLQNIIESCEFMARLFAAGGWHGTDSVSVTDATHKGVTIQFGGGPHPVDWYGTLDAVAEGRLDPLPSIGKVIGLDEVPDAIDQARKSQGPPRIVVHPTAS